MRKLLLLLLSCLLVIGIIACGGDDADDGGDVDPTATVATATEGDAGEEEETPTDDAGDDSGDDDVDSDAVAYFEELKDIEDGAYAELIAISATVEGEGVTFASDEDEIEIKQTGTQDFGEVIEATATEVADLDPPEDAQAEHDQLIESLLDYAARLSFFSEDLQDVETVEELDEVAADYNQGLLDAFAQYDDACVAIELRGGEVIDGYEITCPSE